MPDTRTHRGPHPKDAKLFDSAAIEQLQLALADYSLLLTKGYAPTSSLKLVGDKFALTQRQRLAIMRSGCSDQQLQYRNQHHIDIEKIANQSIAIDGYNLLITTEAAMSNGCIFVGRDSCCKDLASIHGTYRKVTETIPAIELIGKFLEEKQITDVLWLLDKPVSNSGRLKKLFEKIATEYNWNWNVKLSISPDAELIKIDTIVVSSDSVILDSCKKWTNLAKYLIDEKISKPWLINLSTPPKTL